MCIYFIDVTWVYVHKSQTPSECHLPPVENPELEAESLYRAAFGSSRCTHGCYHSTRGSWEKARLLVSQLQMTHIQLHARKEGNQMTNYPQSQYKQPQTHVP